VSSILNPEKSERFFDYRQLHMKLQGGLAVYTCPVSKTKQFVNIVCRNDKLFVVDAVPLQKDRTAFPILNLHADDPLLNFNTPVLGYLNTEDRGVYFLSRISERQNQQTISLRTVKVELGDEFTPESGIVYTARELLSSPIMNNLLDDSNYPSGKEAYEKNMAFTRCLAWGFNKKLGIKILAMNKITVGWAHSGKIVLTRSPSTREYVEKVLNASGINL
jgi:hypothetical protein